MLFRRLLLVSLLCGVSFVHAAEPASLSEPKGKVVLTIKGNIGAKNRGNEAALDMNMLSTLPQHTFTTNTPWSKVPVKFTGPKLVDVLKLVRAKGTSIKASAINDYHITIPAEDATRFDVVVARLINDQPIPVREKGPLFVIYPFDSSADLRTSTYYERSIWQLKSLDIQ
ncbi:molybdopterin-dependent oxidoreductase [Hydrogenophaga sp.]|uniref:molybdopterin-dependent oxidoreductase n=1 Tax=Hydrogenophaga sp. TaxID=1904254 RepID=UPI0035B20E35